MPETNGASFHASTTIRLDGQSSDGVLRTSAAQPAKVPGSLWPSPSHAGPSTNQPSPALVTVPGLPVPLNGVPRRRHTPQTLLPEDEEVSKQAALRFVGSHFFWIAF